MIWFFSGSKMAIPLTPQKEYFWGEITCFYVISWLFSEMFECISHTFSCTTKVNELWSSLTSANKSRLEFLTRIDFRSHFKAKRYKPSYVMQLFQSAKTGKFHWGTPSPVARRVIFPQWKNWNHWHSIISSLTTLGLIKNLSLRATSYLTLANTDTDILKRPFDTYGNKSHMHMASTYHWPRRTLWSHGSIFARQALGKRNIYKLIKPVLRNYTCQLCLILF